MWLDCKFLADCEAAIARIAPAATGVVAIVGWPQAAGALFIAVVLWIPDGIVGSIGNWLRKRRSGTVGQIREDADRRAHDQQRDWEPSGAPKPGEETV